MVGKAEITFAQDQAGGLIIGLAGSWRAIGPSRDRIDPVENIELFGTAKFHPQICLAEVAVIDAQEGRAIELSLDGLSIQCAREGTVIFHNARAGK